MAGLFYLGGRDQNNKQDHHQNKDHHHNEDKSNNYLYLYKDEIYNNNKGFEIWPPQYFQQQNQNQVVAPPPPPPTNFYSFGNNRSSNRSLYFNVEPVRSSTGGFTVTRQGSMNCQDCGNQAKKDCPHMRCRTCCKSRGFDCQTHVKSTWVPAAKRRERLAQLAALPAKRTREASSGGGDDREDDENGGGSGGGGDGGQGGGSALACTRVVNPSSSGLEASHLPPEISSAAVFRCMRVSSIDDEDEEYAYQTAVSIGGHVFKGILYDQGPSDHYNHHRYSSSPVTVAAEASQNHLNLLASTASAATTTAASIDPSSLYTAAAAPFNTYVAAGTPFFAPSSRS